VYKFLVTFGAVTFAYFCTCVKKCNMAETGSKSDPKPAVVYEQYLMNYYIEVENV